MGDVVHDERVFCGNNVRGSHQHEFDRDRINNDHVDDDGYDLQLYHVDDGYDHQLYLVDHEHDHNEYNHKLDDKFYYDVNHEHLSEHFDLQLVERHVNVNPVLVHADANDQ